MAHMIINNLGIGGTATVGGYTFRLTETPVSGSYRNRYTATCSKDGQTASSSVIVEGISQNWTLDANDTEATVYVTTSSRNTFPISGTASSSPIAKPGSLSSGTEIGVCDKGRVLLELGGSVVGCVESTGNMLALASSSSFLPARLKVVNSLGATGFNTSLGTSSFTYDGLTVYYSASFNTQQSSLNLGYMSVYLPYNTITPYTTGNLKYLAWAMVYGMPTGDMLNTETIVGRFAIDISDAGGTPSDPNPGGGGGGTDPGPVDPVDPQWEDIGDLPVIPGEPTFTLHIDVLGATSGSHNNRPGDSRFQYWPDDNMTEKPYGCGGDGGYGGGGGAGASTVVIKKFSTNQAHFKDEVARARGHGYGSGGGKGGKGGDGIVLIYY